MGQIFFSQQRLPTRLHELQRKDEGDVASYGEKKFGNIDAALLGVEGAIEKGYLRKLVRQLFFLLAPAI